MNRIPLSQDTIIKEFLQRLRQHLGDGLKEVIGKNVYCLLYTSDAADE